MGFRAWFLGWFLASFPAWLRRVAAFFDRDEQAAALREEMRLHVELRARKLCQQGLGPAEAARAAQRQFGNAAWYQGESSELWGWAMWERFIQDLRHGARTLAKSPGFTAIAVATLALGLGINTAVFSIVNAVMLRALPYKQPELLVSLWEERSRPDDAHNDTKGSSVGTAGTPQRTTVSVANLADYRHSGVFEGLAAFSVTPMNLTAMETPARVTGESVEWNFFRVLGISPVRGRAFLAEEDTPDADPRVIVTHDFWQARLGGDAGVLDRSIVLDAKPYRIIGVLPAGFQSPAQLGSQDPIEFYVPSAFSKDLLASRGDHEVNVVARLRPGVGINKARAALSTVSSNLAAQYPADRYVRAAIAPLRDDLVRNVRESLLALLGASGLIVLITCVNVANLLMVRAVGRRHETSVRMALGAGRMRMMLQLVTESMLIAAAGCVAGIALGRMLMAVLVAMAPAGTPRIHSVAHNVTMDWQVFGLSAAIATITGLIFGMAPAWQASQVKPLEALKSAGRGSGAKSQVRWRSALTVAEVALSLVLLVGAGLLLRSFTTLMGVDLGFQPDHVIAMSVNLPKLRYPTPLSRLQFFQQLDERVRALPGVQADAYANQMPLRGGWGSGIALDGNSDLRAGPDFQAVSLGYFQTLGIPLLRGRSLTAQDSDGQMPVAVVNQEFARELLHGGDPIGHFMQRGPTAPKITIVGVVNDIRRAGKTDIINPEVYLSAAQTTLYPVSLADLAVRTAGDPRTLVNAISRQIWQIDKDQPVTNVRTMDEIIDLSVSQRWFQTLLLAVFASVAVGLAIVGIYSVLAFSVSQRTSELGIRIALGAAPRSIFGLVLRQAGTLIAAGMAIGLAGALALTRVLQDPLFQVRTTDWQAYAGAIALLSLVALAAAFIPARRGASVNPITALRDE
jgi:putative ABC transport system permease protein